jgi:hypothetical protein
MESQVETNRLSFKYAIVVHVFSSIIYVYFPDMSSHRLRHTAGRRLQKIEFGLSYAIKLVCQASLFMKRVNKAYLERNIKWQEKLLSPLSQQFWWGQ